jgi:hypothetical protein
MSPNHRAVRSAAVRTLCCVGIAVAIAFASMGPVACSSTQRAGPQYVDGWEVVAADYSNLRGLDYVPDYPSIHDAPPGLEPGETYRGVASSVAIWRFYRRDDVREQMAHVRTLGCNALRVWLSSAAYEVEGERFVAKVVDFCRLAEAARLYVMPVLFDYDFAEPNVQARWSDIGSWVRNPSLAELDPASDFRSRPRGGDDYVRAVVTALRDSPALLMWDVMNEPPPMDFLDHYLRLVKQLDPVHPTTIGWGGLSDSLAPGFENEFIAHPALDVLSVHPYGIFYETFAEGVRRMRYINALRNPVQKPMLITELGNPGAYQRYEKVLEFVARDAAQHGQRLGVFLWQAIIGDARTLHPFSGESGLLFADGTARDVVGASAFRDLAVRQGIIGLPPVQQKPRTDPDYYDYRGIPLGVDQVVDFLRHWHERRAPLCDANMQTDGYRFQADLLKQVSVSLMWTSRLPGGQGTEIAPQDIDTIVRRIQEVYPRDLLAPENLDGLVADGWVVRGGPNGYSPVWSHWEDLFADLASTWAGIIERNGLGG